MANVIPDIEESRIVDTHVEKDEAIVENGYVVCICDKYLVFVI